MSTKNRNKYNPIKGFSVKTWAILLLCVILSLSILWVTVYSFYSVDYTQQKVKEVTKGGDEIASLFGTDTFETEVAKLSAKYGLQTVIFTYFNRDLDFTKLVISCNPYFPTESNVKVNFTGAYKDLISTCELNLNAKDQLVSCDIFDTQELFGSNASDSVIVYYAILNLYGLEYFMYATKPLYTLDTPLTVLTEYMTVATIVSFVLTALLAVLFARGVSKPVKVLARNAYLVYNGEYDRHFEGNGTNEIDIIADALNKAAKELNQTQGLRQDVIANVSHDLKTPLTLIKSYAEMLKDFPNAPQNKREERLDLIINETDRLTGLVNEMLRLSQTESGVLPLKKSVFDLSQLTCDVVKVYEVKAVEGYKFDVNITPGLVVDADRIQIQQVLHNYLTNAIKYTGKDKRVKVVLDKVNNTARFDIFDTGKGIGDSDKEKIWDRYYRASSQYTRGSGNGLGLSIVKNILVRHGFKYGVNSVVGKGSDFYFEIPLYEEE